MGPEELNIYGAASAAADGDNADGPATKRQRIAGSTDTELAVDVVSPPGSAPNCSRVQMISFGFQSGLQASAHNMNGDTDHTL